MTAQQKDFKVSVEAEVYRGIDRSPLRIVLSATLAPLDGTPVDAEDVAKATDSLRAMLNVVTARYEGATETPRDAPVSSSPRPLATLRQVYTPRSVEHVDDLLWEGQINDAEHKILLAHLKKPAHEAPPAGEEARGTASQVRTVEALLQQFEIRDLQDANRARGKRVISFDEWSLLKRHFSKA